MIIALSNAFMKKCRFLESTTSKFVFGKKKVDLCNFKLVLAPGQRKVHFFRYGLRLKNCPKPEQLQLWILRTIFQRGASSSDISASQKGLYLFYNPLHHFSRRAHTDRSCIVDFFMFLCAELSTSFLVSPSLASTKSILLFSMTD